MKRGEIEYSNNSFQRGLDEEMAIEMDIYKSPFTWSELYTESFARFLESRKSLLPGELDEHRTKEKSDLLDAPAPAKEIENVESRTRNKRETEARHREWQERINKLAQDSPGKSHTAYCRTLSKQIGVPFTTIRRNTKLGHS